ncbi:MAG: hypothetical protein AB1505_10795 [Candidatus Latescibacterota bacterium]
MLRRFGWAAYDHLGGLVLLNLLWAVLALPWLLAAYVGLQTAAAAGPAWLVASIPLAAQGVLLSPPSLLLFAAGLRWASGQDTSLAELLAAVRPHVWRAQALGAAAVVLSGLAALDAAVYRHLAGWLGLLFSGLMLWFLVAVAMVGLYAYPVLLTQQTGIVATVRHSFAIAMANLRLTGGLVLACLAFLVVGVLSGAGLFLGLLAAAVLLVSVCFRQLLTRYTGKPLPEEPPRTWRQVIRPWEA